MVLCFIFKNDNFVFQLNNLTMKLFSKDFTVCYSYLNPGMQLPKSMY